MGKPSKRWLKRIDGPLDGHNEKAHCELVAVGIIRVPYKIVDEQAVACGFDEATKFATYVEHTKLTSTYIHRPGPLPVESVDKPKRAKKKG